MFYSLILEKIGICDREQGRGKSGQSALFLLLPFLMFVFWRLIKVYISLYQIRCQGWQSIPFFTKGLEQSPCENIGQVLKQIHESQSSWNKGWFTEEKSNLGWKTWSSIGPFQHKPMLFLLPAFWIGRLYIWLLQ